MAAPVLTIKLVDASTVTLVVTNGWTGLAYCQHIAQGGGFVDSAGVWHPSTAILSVTIS